MNKRYKLLGGLIFIVAAASILDNLFHIRIFSMSKLWPLFLLVPGTAFEFAYLKTKRAPGILVPGGILTSLGIVFLFNTYTGWFFAAYTWPFYILSVAIGLYQLYSCTNHSKGLLIPINILTAVSAISFVLMVANKLLWWIKSSLAVSILLLAFGIYLFRKGAQKSPDA